MPESRAEEITNATGVPTRFYVAYDKHVANCHAVERLVHRRLHSFRVAHNREFFELPLKEAIAVIEEIAEQFQP
jgi:T5orf172 domain